MKTILTIKTNKGNKSNSKEVDKTVDELLKINNFIEGKLKLKAIGCKCYNDGTRLIYQSK